MRLPYFAAAPAGDTGTAFLGVCAAGTARAPGQARSGGIGAAGDDGRAAPLYGLPAGVVIFAVHPAVPIAARAAATFSTTTVVIPARYGSTRLPGKPLLDLGGRPMIEHVHRCAAKAPGVERILVATDDRRIADAVAAFGGEAWLTRPDHPTGSDRLAEVARRLTSDIVVNLQGDEPLMPPALIEAVVGALAADPGLGIATARCPITDPATLADPHVVKVVVDARGDALYFSRAPVPHAREAAPERRTLGHRHIGLYAYRRACLLELARIPPTPLERLERLEQLRALESGYRIGTVATDEAPIGVDTPADLERVRHLVAPEPAHA